MKNFINQSEEYGYIKKIIYPYYKKISPTIHLRDIFATKTQVRQFVIFFIKNAIKNTWLQNKLLENFDNDFVLDTVLPYQKDSGGENKHEIITKSNGEIIVVNKKRACIGELHESNKIKTNIRYLRCIIHELAHSVSQKFDNTWMNTTYIQKISQKQNPEKDNSIGEIESKFLEKIFNNFVFNYAETIFKNNLSLGLNAEELKNETTILMQYDILDLIHKLDEGISQNGKNYKQSYQHRYIVGDMIAIAFYNAYIKNPDKKINLFIQFLQNNACLSIDELCMFLSQNKYKNFSKIIKNFKKIYKIYTKNTYFS